MTREWSPWSVPVRSREGEDSWSFAFFRESEAMDSFTIPADRTEALASALGMPTDVVVEQLENEKAEPALIDAWEALAGSERDSGIARLEGAGLAPRSAGTWIPFGDYGVHVEPGEDVAPETR